MIKLPTDKGNYSKLDILAMLNKQKCILESQGYKVAYISVYGSQNYGLDIYNDDYQSDIDMKAVVVPTLDDLILNSKPVSLVVDTEWGQCDVKDIRSYFETLLKANPAYIETLFTKYYIIDDNFKTEFEEILSLKDDLVYALRAQFLRAMYGMMLEKEKAMCHPYPSIIHKIEKWGYDGKQAHHIRRLRLMMWDYFENGYDLSTAMHPHWGGEIRFLMQLKKNEFDLDFVKAFVSRTMEITKLYKDYLLSKIDESVIDYSIKEKFIILSQKIIKEKIVNDIVSRTNAK